MGINNIELSFEDNIEVVEKDELLQQVDELKLEDNISQEIDEEIKEEKKKKLN